MADVLGTDNGSSCCQCLEDLDDKHINGIGQRNRGDGGTSDAGYHHRVSHTHKRRKQLLDNQRNQQFPEIQGGKLQMVPVYLVGIIDFSSQCVVLYLHKAQCPVILSSPVTELWYHEMPLLHSIFFLCVLVIIFVHSCRGAGVVSL